MDDRLLIFGAGFSGRAIAERLRGRMTFVGGTSRSRDKMSALKESGIAPFLFDGETLSDELASEMASTTHLVQSIAPNGIGDPLLNTIGNDLKTHFPALRWVGYLSTVGVYGNHDGGWVDEDTVCRPVSDRSIMRLASETAWQDAGASAEIPVSVLRLSGIYGPGRNAFVSLEKGRARRLIKPGQVFNRIHVDDIAGACSLLLEQSASGLFNVTDDRPAPPQDLIEHAAAIMGVAPPPEMAFEDADLSEMARSFYGENKRVSNGKLKGLGYRFAHPDYEAGLKALWTHGYA